ncbi:hypothetical protein [Halostagnicola sp. GCM10023243]
MVFVSQSSISAASRTGVSRGSARAPTGGTAGAANDAIREVNVGE